MILRIDLAILTGVSVWLGWRVPFLGVMLFVFGILFEFQMGRTRLLLGSNEKKSNFFSKIRAGILTVVLVSCLLPVLAGDPAEAESGGIAGLDWALPVVVLLGFFSAMLMIVLGVERRQR
jgi:hypothetical protein